MLGAAYISHNNIYEVTEMGGGVKAKGEKTSTEGSKSCLKYNKTCL